MIRFSKIAWVFFLALIAVTSTTVGEDQWKPEDPFAAINGEPIFLGELNLVLVERFGVDQVNQLDLRVKQAAAALLVRRHLALRALHEQGGESLAAIVDRQLEALESELKRRGSDLARYAKERLSTEKAVRDDLDFKISWSQYLKSRLTQANLERFFENRKTNYGGGRWEVSQIFVSVDPSDQDAVQSVRDSLDDLVRNIRNSGDIEQAFAAAARDHSDSVSASDGGMMGWVEKDGDLPTKVMQAVRATKAGEISDPVQSPLGLHVVLVHQFEEKPITFSELRDVAQVRRDAANALLDYLIQTQQDARVSWLIKSLEPPATDVASPDVSDVQN
ncbi:PpiC-type peptidyl-prolyl cis-trans isomerase [Rhodopirellula maiorica SM1]|uniref:PpiC-type peptidyl-prolyl cis-trans isomerase n=1 Tax=Rhodopirellula maiorica SM1 TaxID=1265738 RepID=M5RZF8_9BACT|nr:peptidylprolyl isomerase [Rhodopirellula maiorica]EMI19289.1 PpiC-type peptidyl-prolyl cis-trans isomerase [Rhodopirellula maiorica SM1]